MEIPDPVTVGGWIGTFLATGFAVWQTHKASQEKEARVVAQSSKGPTQESLLEAKDALVASFAQMVKEWKKCYEDEHAELSKYREYTHAKQSETQAVILRLNEENALLLSRTDLEPIMSRLTAQELNMVNISKNLADVARILPQILRKLHIEIEETG